MSDFDKWFDLLPAGEQERVIVLIRLCAGGGER